MTILRALTVLLFAFCATSLPAQTARLVFRFTHLHDGAYSHEVGRLDGGKFVLEKDDHMSVLYPDETTREQVKAVSGLTLLPIYGSLVETGRNYRLSTNRFTVRGVDYQVIEWMPAPLMSRFVNVATRAVVAKGGVLIPGLYVADKATKVLVRAVGPGMKEVGVTEGTMANPRLQVYSGQNVIAENDDWEGPDSGHMIRMFLAFQQAGAFPLPPQSKDAALVVTLEPGAYTVWGFSADGDGGDLLVEVYLLDEPRMPPDP